MHRKHRRPCRHITLLPRRLQEIQTQVRHEQDTEQWQCRYAIRAGYEATVSETAHTHGLRRCPYHRDREDSRPTCPHRCRSQHRQAQSVQLARQ
ncbi:transposase [Streptomyces sp. NPDC056663]|uniref:transposase n=1 Tax=Streptomyces sp. NPDC056663 TaxID=3345899 RepID=UPI003681C3C2